ncbi:hypothetical protein BWQ96_05010 [Gracilariopsis chorda]|uniref:Ca3427-like PBP 2 domain-containing protein n=1 Tax=Gracilariopsis chorda TaxID=448386 RepID=A0A2V3IT00_9FLOR|nr:hypothetical protein BWQ96_05010 [Gracilariopsis chorda]|eukprot:PXF45244.1 hypothetical protein BWQ96_05010 [Gracilariopsis chorda]
MNPLTVGGVPEAYNDPFPLANFASHGISVPPRFFPYAGGSGSMIKAVVGGEIDAAFALTDCIVAAIENGTPVRIAGPLIHSPLTWAVIVHPDRQGAVQDLSEATWGISRMNSGSHVMVSTLAKERNWTKEPSFKVCGNFAGLRSALKEGSIDAFLWEHYTTKPYADKRDVKIIGGVPTPWGCFSVVVREDSKRVDEVHRMVDAFVEAGKAFVTSESNAKGIMERYGMAEHDAKAWMSGVTYAGVGERSVNKDMLEKTRRTLLEAGVIKEFKYAGTESYKA